MSGRRVSVVDCPGGPLLVRGADEVVGLDGQVATADRAVVALCRCNRSERLPWCDDSHRARRRKTPRKQAADATGQTRDQPQNQTENQTENQPKKDESQEG